ncbi:hypothetical protein IH601_09920 [Candidatus Bipolaricaulota bacterium]|nr:hypothetical protein [Candidatus Bipolaricaulota bacterium]
MNRRIGMMGMGLLLAAILLVFPLYATQSQLYFASDKNGQDRITQVQEGDEIWIVVIDNDENEDCDVRDKISPDLKLMDPKTGAYIVWFAVPGSDDPTQFDYLEETGSDTGIFVSYRAFQIGSRESFAANAPHLATHVVDVPVDGFTDDFMWGHYLYGGAWNQPADDRVWVAPGPTFTGGLMIPVFWPGEAMPPSTWADPTAWDEYLIGRFENMDTLVGLYVDPDDPTDIAVGMMKIIDHEATIAWSKNIYPDAHDSAFVTISDPDENVNCNEVEVVPVFILVNPGSWNPVRVGSPTQFCMLLNSGGVQPNGTVIGERIRWYNIYNSANADHRYYVEYPTQDEFDAGVNVTWFDTVDADGIAPVSFYAQETSANSGVFQLNLNDIQRDLGFQSLRVRDVLVAYYLDPNDADDFKLATCYIEEKNHSITSFTDSLRIDQETFWIGRDSVYVRVIDSNANEDSCCPEQVLVHVCDPHGEDDSEWLILDETNSNSQTFVSMSGLQLWPVWDALGVGLANSMGGFQLRLDNWKLEAFNEDEIYVRYNDVVYGGGLATATAPLAVGQNLPGIGDADVTSSFPPHIDHVRVANDVSFDLLSVADTQVFDGTTTNMYFLDRQGNRVTEYAASDCIFIEVIDPDQNEDSYRRERIDAYWDGGQNLPFGAQALNEFLCPVDDMDGHWHYVNWLLGDTNIFNDGPANSLGGECWFEDWDGDHAAWPKLYILNPGSGRWAAVDLLETGPASGTFVSVICVDFVNVYECVPNLDVWPGDTLIAVYQDPSNHSDVAWASIKVGLGGAAPAQGTGSTTQFVDAEGHDVETYSDADLVFVKVIDSSHAGATLLANAVDVAGLKYDLQSLGTGGQFMTAALELNLVAGQTIAATYTDPTNPLDSSSDTVAVVSSGLTIDAFVASPTPFDVDVTFSYIGTGVASTMSITIYDLRGTLVQELEASNTTEITWDGTKGARCSPVANGAYIYVVVASDGTNSFTQRGTVFVNR